MFMSHRNIRLWSWLHTWSSLICTLFMLLLCITGLPLIFHEEIDELGTQAPAAAAPGTPPVTLDTIIAAARAARPGEKIAYVFFDPDKPLVTVSSAKSMTAPFEDFFDQVFNMHTGKRFDAAPRNAGFMYVMFRLHVDLFAGLPGMLLLGFMGVLLVVAIVSGIVLYAPFMRKLAFGTIRRRRGSRIRWLDLHNFLGIVTAMWLIVVSLTGVINTLGTLVERHWQATELADMAARTQNGPPPKRLASIDKVVASIHDSAPGKHILTLAFPGTPFASPHDFGAYLTGNTALTSHLLTPVLVDAGSGALSAAGDMPWYVKLLFISQPLHFGDYGGLPLKIIWALFDIVSIAVLGSGLYLWLKRKTRRTNPAANMTEHEVLIHAVLIEETVS